MEAGLRVLHRTVILTLWGSDEKDEDIFVENIPICTCTIPIFFTEMSTNNWKLGKVGFLEIKRKLANNDRLSRMRKMSLFASCRYL